MASAASGQFRLNYTRRAQDDIQRLDKVTKRRLAESLVRFQSSPLHYSTKLVKSKVPGEYRFRVGNYRVLFRLEGRVVQVMRVAHRSEVYER